MNSLFLPIIIALAALWLIMRALIRIGKRRACKIVFAGVREKFDDYTESDDRGAVTSHLVEINSLCGPLNFRDREFDINDEMREFGKSIWECAAANERRYQNDSKRGVYDLREVRFQTEDFKLLSWLADVGLRAMTQHSDTYTRPCERFNKDEAERVTALLDSLDRQIADLVAESEDHRDSRFAAHENRMKQVWENYD